MLQPFLFRGIRDTAKVGAHFVGKEPAAIFVAALFVWGRLGTQRKLGPVFVGKKPARRNGGPVSVSTRTEATIPKRNLYIFLRRGRHRG